MAPFSFKYKENHFANYSIKKEKKKKREKEKESKAMLRYFLSRVFLDRSKN